ncbi:GNAT family N-acetyltransferase [Candidatus Chloroploca asiatica]|uniref:N-acetyltransferase domain-containing protein n=1 Tax=Candidatus Chloroploca asiatica TaxID=1506545 RepID=A0A2H3KR62_9CHLR|nr:GNAT family N-acetyltransferase [Candidatus Chloroploca asiatica]PDW01012.1 hypothetical protein A9Q02_21290 [Candidatus Chloroploca asiatica]
MHQASAVAVQSRSEGGTVTVRLMRADDAEPLRQVVNRAFPLFDRMTFSTHNHDVFVAVDADERVVGGVVLDVSPRPDCDAPRGRTGTVVYICADPEAHLPGIGGALRDAASQYFAQVGCRETFARIDAVNTASQQLHRRGGYELLPMRIQMHRWGWHLPLRWHAAGHGFDPGMQLWVRDEQALPVTTPSLWSRLLVTLILNVLLLGLVAWRDPRATADPLTLMFGLALTATLLLGVREAAIWLVAATQRQQVSHAPWPNGLGLAGLLALGVGVWFPLTGSTTPTTPGWRHERAIPALGRAYLAGGLAVAALTWSVLLITPDPAWVWWPEIHTACTRWHDH